MLYIDEKHRNRTFIMKQKLNISFQDSMLPANSKDRTKEANKDDKIIGCQYDKFSEWSRSSDLRTSSFKTPTPGNSWASKFGSHLYFYKNSTFEILESRWPSNELMNTQWDDTQIWHQTSIKTVRFVPSSSHDLCRVNSGSLRNQSSNR